DGGSDPRGVGADVRPRRPPRHSVQRGTGSASHPPLAVGRIGYYYYIKKRAPPPLPQPRQGRFWCAAQKRPPAAEGDSAAGGFCCAKRGDQVPILERASLTASMMPLLEKVAPAAASTSVDWAAMMASGMVSKAGSETPAVSP